MKSRATFFPILGVLVLAAGLLAGCEDTGGGGSVHGSISYGVGFYDPWYYGPGYCPPGAIVTPPPGRPDSTPRPSHPIAKPSPSPRPTPSIPSRPRPAGRR